MELLGKSRNLKTCIAEIPPRSSVLSSAIYKDQLDQSSSQLPKARRRWTASGPTPSAIDQVKSREKKLQISEHVYFIQRDMTGSKTRVKEPRMAQEGQQRTLPGMVVMKDISELTFE